MKRTLSLAVCLGILSVAARAQEVPRESISMSGDHHGDARAIGWRSTSASSQSSGLTRTLYTSLEAAPDAGGTVENFFKAVNVNRPRSESVIDERGSFALVLPVAISSPGKNGTYFRTDASISNNRSIDQTVGIGWLPNGVSGAGGGILYFTLKAYSVYMIRDFMGSGGLRINRAGVGAVLISGFFAGTSSVDSNADLDASFRIWTYESGSSGTNSFTVSATSGSVYGMWTATSLGLRHDSSFRTNVGIVNVDANFAHTWSVRVVGDMETRFSVTVPSLSMVQVPIPDLAYGDLFIEFTPSDFSSSSVLWSAYAVTADNITGDAWLSRGSQ